MKRGEKLNILQLCKNNYDGDTKYTKSGQKIFCALVDGQNGTNKSNENDGNQTQITGSPAKTGTYCHRNHMRRF